MPQQVIGCRICVILINLVVVVFVIIHSDNFYMNFDYSFQKSVQSAMMGQGLVGNADKCCPAMQALTFKPSCTPQCGAPWFCKVQKGRERVAGILTSFWNPLLCHCIACSGWKDYSLWYLLCHTVSPTKTRLKSFLFEWLCFVFCHFSLSRHCIFNI